MKNLRHIRLRKLLTLAGILLSLSIPIHSLPGEEEGSDSEAEVQDDPMETEGLDPRPARILTRYYEKTFTGLDNWEKLQSVIFEGVLHLPHGKVPFTAHKKKPDFYKIVLRPPRGERVIMAYDGKEAWQLNTAVSDGGPTPMPEAEAQNFIRDAPIGGHLLDPLAEGKEIEFLGIVKVDGRDCFELEVTLPDGQRIRSAIDIIEHAERRQITTNNVNGEEEQNFYSDFRVIGGVRFPFTSTMKSNGEEKHRVEMRDIRINAGLIEAMFQPSSESGAFEDELDAPKQEPELDSGDDSSSAAPFGGSRFGESIFKDPPASGNDSVFETDQRER